MLAPALTLQALGHCSEGAEGTGLCCALEEPLRLPGAAGDTREDGGDTGSEW